MLPSSSKALRHLLATGNHLILATGIHQTTINRPFLQACTCLLLGGMHPQGRHRWGWCRAGYALQGNQQQHLHVHATPLLSSSMQSTCLCFPVCLHFPVFVCFPASSVLANTYLPTLAPSYNACAFDGRLPNDLVVSWSKHLKTTAGVTHYSRTILPSTAHPRSSLGQAPADDSYAACPSGAGSVAVGDAGADALASDAVSTTTTTSSPPFLYTARIELSTKVLDNEAKLRRTLVHEMCHAAAWLLDHTAKPPHGPVCFVLNIQP